MRVTPLIEKLEKEKLKTTGDLNSYEEPTDSDSDDDDERFTPDAVKKRFDEFQRKFTRHEELLKNFTQAGITILRCFFLFAIRFIFFILALSGFCFALLDANIFSGEKINFPLIFF